MQVFIIIVKYYTTDELKYESNSICCLTDDQYDGIVEYLLRIFPQTDSSIEVFLNGTIILS